jgi:XTP/dITP diphosphohydrolase
MSDVTELLLLATRNPGKRRELKALLAALPLRLLTTDDLDTLPLIEEAGETYADNARLKARTFAQAAGLWTLADDTGLEVQALGGIPGLRSARLVPGRPGQPVSADAERRRRLLELLRYQTRPWHARFRCAVALSSPQGEVDLEEGECAGQIIPEERGMGGFGYDPLFLLEEVGKTMAELSMEEKNHLSHRARAVNALLPTLRHRLGLPDTGE